MIEQKSSSSIDKYLSGDQPIEFCKDDLLKRINKVKNKIDELDPMKEQLMEYKISEEQKKTLKYVQTQFEMLAEVMHHLQKQHMHQFKNCKGILIRNIKNQLTRFEKIIPEVVQKNVLQSCIRNPILVSQIKLENILQQKENQFFLKQASQQQVLNQMINKINLFLEQSSVEIEAIQNANYLSKQDIQLDAITEIYQENQQTSRIRDSNDQISLEQEQMRVQRQKYWQFIRKDERAKKYQKAKKTAKCVLYTVLSVALFLLIILSVLLYKILKVLGVLGSDSL